MKSKSIKTMLLVSGILCIVTFLLAMLVFQHPENIYARMGLEFSKIPKLNITMTNILRLAVFIVNMLIILTSMYILKYKSSLNPAFMVIAVIWILFAVYGKDAAIAAERMYIARTQGADALAAYSMLNSVAASVERLDIFTYGTMLSGIFAGVINKEKDIEV